MYKDMFWRECVTNVKDVILRYQIKAWPRRYIDTVAYGKVLMRLIGDARINDVVKYEDEFKNYLNKNISIDYGGGYVSITIPKPHIKRLELTQLINHPKFKNAPGTLKIALGESDNAQLIIGDLENWQRVLIGGSAGGGKSTTIHAIICSLISTCTPKDLRLVLFDLKGNELNEYEQLSHLLVPVVTSVGKSMITLEWLVDKMKERYELLKESGYRNFNRYRSESNSELPYIVVIIDEFHMLTLNKEYGKDAVNLLTKLSSLSRAAGIYMIIATQQPNAEIISSEIKTNFPVRIAFQVPSWRDSHIILDQKGAEQLRGKGDMILKEQDGVYRLQGAFIDEEGVAQIVSNYIGTNFEDIMEVKQENELIVIDEKLIEGEDEISDVINEFIKVVPWCIQFNQCSRTTVREFIGRGWKIADIIMYFLKRLKIIERKKDGRYFPTIITLEQFEENKENFINIIKEEYYGICDRLAG